MRLVDQIHGERSSHLGIRIDKMLVMTHRYHGQVAGPVVAASVVDMAGIGAYRPRSLAELHMVDQLTFVIDGSPNTMAADDSSQEQAARLAACTALVENVASAQASCESRAGCLVRSVKVTVSSTRYQDGSVSRDPALE